MTHEKFEMPFFLKIDSKRKAILVTDKTIDKLYGEVVCEQLKNIFKKVEKKIIDNNLLNSSFDLALFVINNVIIGLGGGKVLKVICI